MIKTETELHGVGDLNLRLRNVGSGGLRSLEMRPRRAGRTGQEHSRAGLPSAWAPIRSKRRENDGSESDTGDDDGSESGGSGNGSESGSGDDGSESGGDDPGSKSGDKGQGSKSGGKRPSRKPGR